MEKQQANQIVEKLKNQLMETKQLYEQRIREINQMNEQEFLKFEQIISETLKKKDGNIQKLKMAIDTLRNGFDS